MVLFLNSILEKVLFPFFFFLLAYQSDMIISWMLITGVDKAKEINYFTIISTLHILTFIFGCCYY